eukprot:2453619-Amphidinium_carterae.1
MFAKHGWDRLLSKHRWKCCSTRSQHMWCMARTAPDGYIRLLAENCDSVSPVYFSIFEVRWGSQSRNAAGGAMLMRGNLPFTRMMIVHVDHLAATKQPSLSRDALARLSALNIVYQVDVMGGDFNASVYRYFAAGRSKQRCASLADSSLRQVLSSMATVVNNELQTQCGGSVKSWMGH